MMEKEYYDAQIKYMNEIQSIRHDMQAHMIVLQYYLESENYEKAKAYLKEMKSHQSLNRQGVKDTGNDLVNAIINDCINRSKKEIEFELEGMLPEKLDMNEYDICTVFSNIFSNAREACDRLEEIKPVIRMEIKEEKECIVLIRNPIEWKVQTNASGFVTSKRDSKNHGYGTKNILKAIKRSGGKIEFLVTDSYFQVEIRMPMNKGK